MKNITAIITFILVTSCSSKNNKPDPSDKFTGKWKLVKSTEVTELDRYKVSISKSDTVFTINEDFAEMGQHSYKAWYDKEHDRLMIEQHDHGVPEITYDAATKRIVLDGGEWALDSSKNK